MHDIRVILDAVLGSCAGRPWLALQFWLGLHRVLQAPGAVRERCGNTHDSMADSVKQLIIQGITSSGSTFRPSDWAERLAGVMACFRPAGSASSHITYSPYVVPRFIDGIKCVVVDERIRGIEPLAWKFAVDFARDNGLQTIESTVSPDDPPIK